MSVDGVANATIISQYISAAVVVIVLINRKETPYALDLKKIKIDLPALKKILVLGLPAGLQGTLFSISNVVIQSSINSFGSVVIAGSSAASNIESFIYPCANSFHQAALTFISQNYGAGKCKRVDRTAILCLCYGAFMSLTVGNLIYFFGEPLVALYAPGEPEVIAQAVVRLGFVAAYHFLCAFMDIMVGILRGIGHSMIPMIVSLIGSCALRLVWIATIFQIYTTPACLYVSYPISWAVTALAHVIFFFAVRKRTYRQVSNRSTLSN
jgi:Na+-driven multidrug efflux pump